MIQPVLRAGSSKPTFPPNAAPAAVDLFQMALAAHPAVHASCCVSSVAGRRRPACLVASKLARDTSLENASLLSLRVFLRATRVIVLLSSRTAE